MTPSTPLIDPTTEQLGARFDAAGCAGREVLAFSLGRSAGVAAVGKGEGPNGLGVCWWTDRLGRRHWAFPSELDPADAVRAASSHRDIWLYPNRHPLEWIAPPLSCGWRERGGRRGFVAACRCGVVGSPQSVGWMGQTCGPCHDREQEGMQLVGQPIRRLEAGCLCDFEVTSKGRLIAWFDHPYQGWVQAWDPPWTGEPAWTRFWASGWQIPIAPDGSRYVLAAENTYVVGNTATGEMQPPVVIDPLLRVKLAGASGNRLVGAIRWERPPPTLSTLTWKNCYQLAVLRVGKGVEYPLLDLAGEELRFSETVPNLAVSPDGRRIFADRGNEVRAWDAASLSCRDRLRLSQRGTVSALVPLADGAVIAAGETDGSPWLMRWPSGGQGLRGWLLGPSVRAPDRVVPLAGQLDRLRATPDGQAVCGLRDGMLVLHDARTLGEVAAFRPADAALTGGFAFAPDGLLLAGTQRGLAVWSWREVFGVTP